MISERPRDAGGAQRGEGAERADGGEASDQVDERRERRAEQLGHLVERGGERRPEREAVGEAGDDGPDEHVPPQLGERAERRAQRALQPERGAQLGAQALRVLHADKAVQSAYGVEGIPVVYLVDRQGRVRWHRVGFSSGGEEDIAREIEKLLDEPSEPPTSSG